MSNYAKMIFQDVPQSEPQFGKNQVINNAGGYVYKLDEWKVLDRFLILGSESNTYYTSAKKLSLNNANNIMDLLAKDGKRFVDRVVEISDAGRAPKNDPAVFAMAIACAFGNDATKKYAYDNLSKVCRIGTHLFQFVDDVSKMRGWGRGLRTAVSNWYTNKDLSTLVYQLIKYKNRNGWSHKDVLRVAHPKPNSKIQSALFSAVTRGFDLDLSFFVDPDCERFYIASNIEKIANGSVDKVVELIKEYNLPREVVPTQMLNEPKVWMAMLEDGMPLTAMIRNLGKMSSIGVLDPFSKAISIVTDALTNENFIRKSRVHPINILNAKVTYNSGRGNRGSNTWEVNDMVNSALEDCFYLSFGNVTPSNKNTMIALDVSGSMFGNYGGAYPMDNQSLSAAEVSAAMAMVTIRTEPNYMVLGFSHKLEPININKNSSLQEVLNKMRNIPMGGTDCALPMIYARKNKIPVEVFSVWTDNETWYGDVHPDAALKSFRKSMGIDAKLVVAGVTATEFTIADPKDPGMLDVVGFDSAVPELISEFARGNI